MKNKKNDKKELKVIKKNDSYLFTANIVFLICLGCLYGICVISAIILFIYQSMLSGILVLVISTESVFIMFIFFKLFLSLLFDIKMIRNELYNIENNSIYSYYNKEFSDKPQYKSETEYYDNLDNYY